MGQKSRIDKMPINDVEVYRVIYDKLLQGVVVVRNDRVQYANQALSEIAGVPLETIMTWRIDDILGVLTEDHEGTVKHLYRETALGHKEEGILRFAFTRPNGITRFIEVIPTIIHSEDEQIYHAIIADVTERVEAENSLRESEEQFRRTFDAIPDPAYLWERRKDGEIVLKMVNQVIGRYSRGMIDQYIGKTPEELLPDSAEMTLSVRKTMETGEGLERK